MRAVAAAAVVLATLAPAPAHADTGLIGGTLCSFDATSDLTGHPGTESGIVTGGPLALIDRTDPTVVRSAYLTCTIQVGATGATHAGPDAFAASGPLTPGVVALPPTRVWYYATPFDPVYLCTKVTVPGEGTYYWNDYGQPDGLGHWTTSSGSYCRLAVEQHDPLPAGAGVVARYVPPFLGGVRGLCYDVTVSPPGIDPVTVTVCPPLVQ